MDVLTCIDQRARAAPDVVAQRSGGRTLTYGELARRSDALAAYLARTLPDDRSPIAVHGHKEPEMLVAFLACAKAGHPYIPLDVALPRQRVDAILAVAEPPLVLTPDGIAAHSEGDAPPPVRRPGPDDPLYIMFTSGSTGEPKGVVITRGNLGAFVRWMGALIGPAERTVVLDQATYSFDLSVMSLYPCLTAGGTLVSITKVDLEEPRRLFAALAASDVETWVSTPSFAQMCLAERSFGHDMLPRLRRWLFCGETLPPTVAAQLLERFPGTTVWNTYGPTEATVATTAVRIDHDVLARFTALPIGYPMPDARVVVVDDALRELPPGTRGEILIAGPNVSPGYLHRPDLTARAFLTLEHTPAYRTGDWGEVRDRLLFFGGRMDAQIKLHGYRIEIGDVEAHLTALPDVSGAVVIPVRRDGTVTALTAFVVLRHRPPGSDFSVAMALRRQLAERLPAYMLPSTFRVVEAFPTTANGKVDRKTLAARLAP